jgi:hypothetical protein
MAPREATDVSFKFIAMTEMRDCQDHVMLKQEVKASENTLPSLDHAAGQSVDYLQICRDNQRVWGIRETFYLTKHLVMKGLACEAFAQPLGCLRCSSQGQIRPH